MKKILLLLWLLPITALANPEGLTCTVKMRDARAMDHQFKNVLVKEVGTDWVHLVGQREDWWMPRDSILFIKNCQPPESEAR